MTIWLTADTHFGHAAVIDFCQRPFVGVEGMDTILLRNINFWVKPQDTLYVVGDFTLGGRKYIEQYRAQIKCQNVHLVRGNHDSSKDRDYATFQSVRDHVELKHNKTRIVLNHYPMESWRGSRTTGCHFHGHCHGESGHVPGRLDVGMDPMGGVPVRLEAAMKWARNESDDPSAWGRSPAQWECPPLRGNS